ncbi:MAG TPA: type II secretion system F family protein [Sedimentisphaerales bacterium]|nr:type II secretion system F family protein [Sedimentisphaerales bacterium]
MAVVEKNLVCSKPAPKSRVLAPYDFRSAEEKLYVRDIPRRVSTKDVCRLARQLATLLHAGMPLVPALSALVEQLRDVPERKKMPLRSADGRMAEIIRQVAHSVNAGSTLSCALAKHPGVFSNLFVHMVAAGEASGTLEEVLLRLAEMLQKRVNLTGKVKSAIAYPLMMAVVAAGVVLFLLSFVVPAITQIFLEMNRALPWPTRLLMSISYVTKTYFVLIAAVVCVAFFGIRAAYKTEKGRLFADRLKLRLPLFGGLFQKLEIARLTRTLGILLTSGIPILDALQIAEGVIQNRFIAGALEAVRDLVGKGDNIANAIRKSGLFPPIVFHIISTGQAGGNLEAGLIDIADMYDTEVEMTAKMLTSLLEPAILLLMGIIVGFIVLAILLPIFEINQAL